jgi:hypothetical protein
MRRWGAAGLEMEVVFYACNCKTSVKRVRRSLLTG